jgi:hypothetical protein
MRQAGQTLLRPLSVGVHLIKCMHTYNTSKVKPKGQHQRREAFRSLCVYFVFDNENILISIDTSYVDLFHIIYPFFCSHEPIFQPKIRLDLGSHGKKVDKRHVLTSHILPVSSDGGGFTM